MSTAPSEFVSHKEIAAKAGVSRAAVSYALRDDPKISARVRKRVKKVARELGYHPDPQVTKLMFYLRQSRAKRTLKHIALLVPGYSEAISRTDQRLQQMITGVSDQARQHGFLFDAFWISGVPGMTLPRIRRILRTRRIDGLIVGSMARGNDTLDFDFTGFSAAALGYSMRIPNIHRVCPHHFRAMSGLFAELARRGFRRVGAVLSVRLDEGSHNLLAASFLHAQFATPEAERLPLWIQPEPQLTTETIGRYLREHRPEVLVGPGYVHRVLLELGLSVPRDLSFVSIDLGDEPYDACGFDGRYDLVGRHAVDLVATQFTLNQTGVPKNPKVVMVDSSWRDGFTLASRPPVPRGRRRARPKP